MNAKKITDWRQKVSARCQSGVQLSKWVPTDVLGDKRLRLVVTHGGVQLKSSIMPGIAQHRRTNLFTF